jgi:hypothetical protein
MAIRFINVHTWRLRGWIENRNEYHDLPGRQGSRDRIRSGFFHFFDLISMASLLPR